MSVLKTVKLVASDKPRGYVIVNVTDAGKRKRWTGEEPAPGGLVEKSGFKLDDVVQNPARQNLIEANFSTAMAIHEAAENKLLAVGGVGEAVASRLKEAAAKFIENVPAG